MNSLKIVAIAALFFFSTNTFAELVMSAPPRGAEGEERATYEPLAEAMSKVIGEKVRYVFPRDFIEYSVEMQKGAYDIVFDGPHFSQWRVKNLNHKLLVNLPENLQFFVVTNKENLGINTLHDLIYEKVCAQLTPQLGTLMLLQNYYERAVEPRLQLVHGEDKVFSDFQAGKCSAAVLRDKSFFKMTKAERAHYKIVYKSKAAPNDAITVNSKVNANQRKALINLLTNPKAMSVAAPIFNRFSRDANAFNPIKAKQYRGLDQLLLMAFGWETKATTSEEKKAAQNSPLAMNSH